MTSKKPTVEPKSLTILTRHDKPLLHSVQLLFTVTLDDPESQSKEGPLFAWEVVSFKAKVAAEKSFTWYPGRNMSLLADNTFDHARVSDRVEPGHYIEFDTDETWDINPFYNGNDDQIIAINRSRKTVQFVLGTVPPTGNLKDFQPYLLLRALRAKEGLATELPYHLQAYVVTHTARHHLVTERLTEGLFKQGDHAMPVRLNELAKATRWLLYSDGAKVTLENISQDVETPTSPVDNTSEVITPKLEKITSDPIQTQTPVDENTSPSNISESTPVPHDDPISNDSDNDSEATSSVSEDESEPVVHSPVKPPKADSPINLDDVPKPKVEPDLEDPVAQSAIVSDETEPSEKSPPPEPAIVEPMPPATHDVSVSERDISENEDESTTGEDETSDSADDSSEDDVEPDITKPAPALTPTIPVDKHDTLPDTVEDARSDSDNVHNDTEQQTAPITPEQPQVAPLTDGGEADDKDPDDKDSESSDDDDDEPHITDGNRAEEKDEVAQLQDGKEDSGKGVSVDSDEDTVNDDNSTSGLGEPKILGEPQINPILPDSDINTESLETVDLKPLRDALVFAAELINKQIQYGDVPWGKAVLSQFGSPVLPLLSTFMKDAPTWKGYVPSPA